MARLASQVKAGFYPIPPEALAHILKALTFEGDVNVLDPCAGKGKALKQIVEYVGKETEFEAHPYAIELDEGRAQTVRQEFGEGALAPADCYNCQVTAGSIQLLFLNPPYDNELGGGSTEMQFLQHAHWWLQDGGVLIYVVPEDKVGRYSPSLKFLAHNYDRLKYMPFPDKVRKYREAMFICTKLKYVREQTTDEYNDPDLPDKLVAKDKGSYKVPKRRGGPRTFAKVAMTPAEMGRALSISPLQRHLLPPAPLALARPPLPLSKGHTAVLLSAGHLNGKVSPPGEEPHVIRGSCVKQTYVKEQTTEERADGTVIEKRVESERFVLTIRAVEQDGTFYDLKNDE